MPPPMTSSININISSADGSNSGAGESSNSSASSEITPKEYGPSYGTALSTDAVDGLKAFALLWTCLGNFYLLGYQPQMFPSVGKYTQPGPLVQETCLFLYTTTQLTLPSQTRLPHSQITVRGCQSFYLILATSVLCLRSLMPFLLFPRALSLFSCRSSFRFYLPAHTVAVNRRTVNSEIQTNKLQCTRYYGFCLHCFLEATKKGAPMQFLTLLLFQFYSEKNLIVNLQ